MLRANLAFSFLQVTPDRWARRDAMGKGDPRERKARKVGTSAPRRAGLGWRIPQTPAQLWGTDTTCIGFLLFDLKFCFVFPI